MYGIIISDSIIVESADFLSFDLRHILAVLADQVLASQWRCRFVECFGEGAAELHALSNEGRIVAGAEFIHIASRVDQTIDGDFQAYDTGEERPWLIIRAVDSSWFDVLTCDPAVIKTLRQHFRQVRDYPLEHLLGYELGCQ